MVLQDLSKCSVSWMDFDMFVDCWLSSVLSFFKFSGFLSSLSVQDLIIFAVERISTIVYIRWYKRRQLVDVLAGEFEEGGQLASHDVSHSCNDLFRTWCLTFILLSSHPCVYIRLRGVMKLVCRLPLFQAALIVLRFSICPSYVIRKSVCWFPCLFSC